MRVRWIRFRNKYKYLYSISKPVRDWVATITAKILLGDLHTRGGLPALVFRDVKQMLHPFDRGPVKALLDDIINTTLAFHQTFQNGVQDRVRWKQI